MPLLTSRLGELAHTSELLIGCDFDGTLAPLVDDPAAAVANAQALRAVHLLAALPHTHVAVVSGRALSDLSAVSGLSAPVRLIGSHGAEFDVGVTMELESSAKSRLDQVVRDVERVVSSIDGVRVELKPAGAAVHYRTADATEAQHVVDRLMRDVVDRDGVWVKHGKMVVELSVVPCNKGEAFERVRSQVGASAAVFFGDDLTDEDAFLSLAGPDIGVFVGESRETAAGYRLRDVDAVAEALGLLYERRREWLHGRLAVAIDDQALLSDGRNVALVDSRGRVSWMCAPRPDAGSVFDALLGGDGVFEIAPIDARGERGSLRYADGSLVSETRWPGLTVVDYLADSGMHRAHMEDSELVRVIDGDRPALVRFAPRPEFGQGIVNFSHPHDDVWVIASGGGTISLAAPGVQWVESDGRLVARTDPSEYPLTLRVRFGSSIDVVCDEPRLRRNTIDAWRNWTDTLRLPELERDLLARSAITLKALCHHPTGAILAAATTSLPAQIGGVRNWDYRYCWLRDAALTARTLLRVGSAAEAHQFLAWLMAIVESQPDPDRLRPLYSLQGHELGSEATLAHLAGYRGHRPVRVGNAAPQVQLDVFGAVMALIDELSEVEGEAEPRHLRLVEALVSVVAHRWSEPDFGIWEARRAPRHYVHSKTMCWYTIDRAIAIVERHGVTAPDGWQSLRDAIAADVLERGWSETHDSYMATYDDDELDAAVLQMVLTGLLAPSDRRAVATVDAIELALRDGPVVRRYRYDDGLPGHDAGFHICTGWLIEAKAKLGQHSEALDLLKGFTSLAGSAGLYSEGYDTAHAVALGNFPQAYSHLALIDAALALAAPS